MATWAEVIETAPEFAASVRSRFDAYKHKVLATLRADGSPRVSGIEAEFVAGQIVMGSMPDSRKAADLVRDGRMSLHSGSPDAGEDGAWAGDAKLSGKARRVTDPAEAKALLTAMGTPEELHGAAVFVVDLREVVLTGLNEERTAMVIKVWRDGKVDVVQR